jgi:hypothetical protein
MATVALTTTDCLKVGSNIAIIIIIVIIMIHVHGTSTDHSVLFSSLVQIESFLGWGKEVKQ